MTNNIKVEFIRSGLVESSHNVFLCHINRQGVIFDAGCKNKDKYFLRSCMKPLQMSIISDFDLEKHFNLSLPEIAVASSSHCGETLHVNLVRSILNKAGVSEDDLLCPAEAPLSKIAQDELIAKNLPVLKVHSNCSGKHAMMLAACVKEGYDIKNYDSSSHPLQKHIKKKIAEIAAVSESDLPETLDGCGLPVYAMSLYDLAVSYLNLFCSTKYGVLLEAFIEYPYVIGGENRLDSEIINASSGNLIAKVGAGGLVVILNIKKQEAVALKVEDASMAARAVIAVEYLKAAGWLAQENIDNSALSVLADTKIKTADKRIVGEVVCRLM